MSISNIRKLPDGEIGSGEGKCIKSDDVSLNNLYSDLQDQCYKYCIHKDTTRRQLITNLNYGGRDLTDESGSTTLISKHPDIKKVYTYYSATYHRGKNIIEKPLLLRLIIKNSGRYPWYENTGDPSNTKWRKIQNGGKNFYDRNREPTPALKTQLNKVACQLHNLHFVDIYQVNTYYCACNKTEVTTITENSEGSIKGYTKYEHTYSANPNSVRYKKVNLSYRDNEDGEYEPFSLNQRTPHLTVYYWDEDKDRRRPLLMEIYVGGNFEGNEGMQVPLGNDGNVSDNDNTKWSMILDEGVPKILSGDELKKVLQELKCRLFHPAIIDVSAKNGRYPNTYCTRETREGICGNGECPKNVTVTDCTDSTSNLKNYTAKIHTYGEKGDKTKTFTITDFKGGPKVSFPILDVKEVVVFFASCSNSNDGATKTPLLIYVGSDCGKTKKWYRNTDLNGISWVEKGELGGHDPKTASNLEGILDELKIECQKEKEVREKKEAEEREIKERERVEQERVQKEAEAAEFEGKLLDVVGPLIEFGSLVAGFTVADLAHNLSEELKLALQLAEDTITFKLLVGNSVPQEQSESGTVSPGPAVVKGVKPEPPKLQETAADKEAQDDPNQTELPASLAGPNAEETQTVSTSAAAMTLVSPTESQAQHQDVHSNPVAPGHSPLSPPKGSNPTNPGIAIGVPTGILTTSVLACFAGWKLYNRYKGDPWVRQI